MYHNFLKEARTLMQQSETSMRLVQQTLLRIESLITDQGNTVQEAVNAILNSVKFQFLSIFNKILFRLRKFKQCFWPKTTLPLIHLLQKMQNDFDFFQIFLSNLILLLVFLFVLRSQQAPVNKHD